MTLTKALSMAKEMHDRYWCLKNDLWGYNGVVDDCGDHCFDENAMNLSHEGDVVIREETIVELTSTNSEETWFHMIPSFSTGYYHMQHVGSGFNIRSEGCLSVSEQTKIEFFEGKGDCTEWELIEMDDVVILGHNEIDMTGSDAHFQVFPNPLVGDKIKILINSKFDKHSRIYLSDLSGNFIMEEPIVTQNMEMSINNLGVGIYVVHIHTVEGKQFSKLLIE